MKQTHLNKYAEIDMLKQIYLRYKNIQTEIVKKIKNILRIFEAEIVKKIKNILQILEAEIAKKIKNIQAQRKKNVLIKNARYDYRIVS